MAWHKGSVAGSSLTVVMTYCSACLLCPLLWPPLGLVPLWTFQPWFWVSSPNLESTLSHDLLFNLFALPFALPTSRLGATMDVSAPALGLCRRLHAPPHHFAILSCHKPFAGADTRSDSGKPPLLHYTTALQNLSCTSAFDLIFFHNLAMFNNATWTGKRKCAIVKGGIDSDSGEKRDVNIWVTVDGQDRSRVS
jgi:hypothetical protein